MSANPISGKKKQAGNIIFTSLICNMGEKELLEGTEGVSMLDKTFPLFNKLFVSQISALWNFSLKCINIRLKM